MKSTTRTGRDQQSSNRHSNKTPLSRADEKALDTLVEMLGAQHDVVTWTLIWTDEQEPYINVVADDEVIDYIIEQRTEGGWAGRSGANPDPDDIRRGATVAEVANKAAMQWLGYVDAVAAETRRVWEARTLQPSE